MTTPMSTSLIPPEAGAGEIARNEMQSRLAGLGNLGGKKMDPAQKEKKLRESCEGFESIFIQKMWEEMRKTLPKSTLLHGKEEQFWQGMYDQELAKKMTSAGGIGLADMMYAQLSRGLVSASRSTATDASAMGQRAFTPEAAPMLTPTNAAEAERSGSAAAASGNRRAPGSAASVYDGVSPLQDAGLVSNGSAAARTLTGDQAAADGQDPDEAARRAQQAMHGEPGKGLAQFRLGRNVALDQVDGRHDLERLGRPPLGGKASGQQEKGVYVMDRVHCLTFENR